METFEWNWKTSDGLQMYSKSWAPKGRPKATVCLVHGHGEHIGRYAHVAAALTEKGYALLGFDLRGHGKSAGPRGHTPSYEALMNDLAAFFDQVEARYPDLPRFLYGHSLGGILAISYALRRKPQLAGVISTAAGLRTALEEQKFKVMMARVLGALIPTMTIASGLDPSTLSRDPAVVQAYVTDPLVHDKMTLGFGKTMLSAIPWVFEHANEFPLPLLIMHGTKDMLGYPRGSQEFASLAPKEMCTLKMWEGFYHEIHNEPEKAEVFKVMTDWLAAHLTGQTASNMAKSSPLRTREESE